MKLTPEEQKVRQENIARNLLNQITPVIKRYTEGSYNTHKRYLSVGTRFCKFLGQTSYLQNFRNVEHRHVKAYVEYLQDKDCSSNYILTELAGIKWIHKRMNPKSDLPHSNKSFHVDKRNPYKWNCSILPHEFDGLIKEAQRGNRTDVVITAYIERYFGLRHEECVTLRVHQIEDAIRYKQLHLKNTKGGQARDVPVETELQEKILKRLLEKAKESRKKPMDYLICDNHAGSVKKKMKSLENWMNNHKKYFVDPNRTKLKEPGKKPREDTVHWHSLRHSYYQETKKRLLAEGRLTKAQIEKELTESMGHHRNDINNTYSDDLERIK